MVEDRQFRELFGCQTALNMLLYPLNLTKTEVIWLNFRKPNEFLYNGARQAPWWRPADLLRAPAAMLYWRQPFTRQFCFPWRRFLAAVQVAHDPSLSSVLTQASIFRALSFFSPKRA
jgi:hypothetical protein